MPLEFAWLPDVATGLGQLAAAAPGHVVFDADGTLWQEDVVVRFLDHCLERLPAREADPAFAHKLARVRGEINYETAALQHALFAGMTLEQAADWAEESFREIMAPTIYGPVARLVRDLAAVGHQVWVCSGSPRWLVLPGALRLGIPPERVIASEPTLSGDTLMAEPALVTAGAGKAEILGQKGISPSFAAGDSMSDYPMMRMATHALVLAPPDPDGRRGEVVAKAREHGWWVQPVGH